MSDFRLSMPSQDNFCLKTKPNFGAQSEAVRRSFRFEPAPQSTGRTPIQQFAAPRLRILPGSRSRSPKNSFRLLGRNPCNSRRLGSVLRRSEVDGSSEQTLSATVDTSIHALLRMPVIAARWRQQRQ